MRHEEYMKMKMNELQPDEDKLMDEFYSRESKKKDMVFSEDMVNSPLITTSLALNVSMLYKLLQVTATNIIYKVTY